LSAQRLLQYSRVTLGIVLLLLPALAYFALQISVGSAEVENWLPVSRPERQAYNKFVQLFGQDHFLIASWPGCRADEKLEEFTEILRQEFAERPHLGVRSVSSTSTVLNELQVQARVPLSVAHDRLKKFLVGDDGTAVLLLTLDEAAASNRQEIVSTLQQTATRLTSDQDPLQLVIAGEPYQMLMIDQASREAMEKLVLPSMMAALLMAWLCLKSVRLTAVIFVWAGVGQLITVVLIYLVAGKLSAVMVVLPTLVFMLTLSSAVHLTNYYIDCGGDANPQAAVRSLALGFKPCLFATLTTVFGFASLTVSQLEPVWRFGILAAMGLLSSTFVLLSVFPAAVRWYWPRTGTAPVHLSSPVNHRPGLFQLGNSLAKLTLHMRVVITLAGGGVLLVAAIGITKLQPSTEFIDMFAPSHPAIQQLNWVEQHIGPISSLEIVASFRQSSDADLLGRALKVRQLQETLERSPRIVAVMSPASMLPELPQQAGIGATIQRAAIRRAMVNRLSELNRLNLIAADQQHEYWRITARVAALGQANYASVRQEILNLCDRFAERSNQGLSSDSSEFVRIELSGIRVVVEEAHHSLLTDLSSSFAMAFLLITPAMMMIVRRFWLGLLVMLPNLLPVMLVFGVMGWMGIKLDVASILTAGVALGISVDDTLHLMSWYLHARRNHSNQQAIATALQHCARAMLHTTLICCSAMLPFFFSTFEPTKKFALLMMLILLSAILADLLYLPALLQSRLGRRLTQSLGPND
jgi:uncharacterized protein